jgi:hypothetical protein
MKYESGQYYSIYWQNLRTQASINFAPSEWIQCKRIFERAPGSSTLPTVLYLLHVNTEAVLETSVSPHLP